MNSFTPDQFIEQFLAVQAQVYGYIATLLPNRVDADDLFQQTSLVLWRKRAEFDPSREFLPWALGIAHNQVRSFLRRRNRGGTHLSDALMERLADLRHASAGRVEDRFQRLADCMEQLTPEQRGLVEQCYTGAETIKVIAERQLLDPGVLYKRLDRIRWKLMDCIESAEHRENQQ